MTDRPTTRHRHSGQRVQRNPDNVQADPRRRRLSVPSSPQPVSEDDDWTTAIFFDAPDANANRDPAARLYARLEHVFLRWAWFAGFPTWDAAVRSLARTLRGLERADLIERHTLRTDRGQPVRRIFTLTAHGREVATLLSGGADCGEVSP